METENVGSQKINDSSAVHSYASLQNLKLILEINIKLGLKLTYWRMLTW